MKYLSLFSGIGGFELGIGPEHECIGFSEIDKYATQIYQRHFPNHKNYGDITQINAEELPDFDLVVGGFPCQAFSIAGKRGGFEDTRGTLFFDIARILSAKRPRLVLLENVKGLLSHDEGRTFRTIITTLDELGYDCQWEVLNAKDFGVPQNRERVFIVGHLRGTPRPQVFPIAKDNGKSCEVVGRLEAINGHDYLKRVYSPTGSSPTLPTGTGGNHEGKFIVEGEDRWLSAAIRNKDRSKHQGKPGQKYGDYPKHYHLETRKDEVSYTVKSATQEFLATDGVQIRRLTPLECERLMGLPDGWTEGVSDTQRYKVCGNGVVTNVVQAVVSRLT